MVLDIEGTTTPVSFVYDVLFPYARQHVREYLAEKLDSEELRDVVHGLRAERAADATRGAMPDDVVGSSEHDPVNTLVAYVEWLMDHDRKSTALKLLQGKVWERGYRDGTLKGEVFPDVPPALTRWHAEGLSVAIYSSGSVLAQRLLFSTTPEGDLTGFITNFFDTSVGPKHSADSYRRITQALKRDPSDLLFVSDVTAELAAASGAGIETVLCLRPGHAEPPATHEERISSFDELVV